MVSVLNDIDTSFDLLERRCPRLGGPIAFQYCRDGAEPGRPCFKLLDCWWEIFDVETYCRRHFSAETFSRLVDAPPPNKVAGLLDLIQQARKRLDDE